MPILNKKADYALLILCYLHHQQEGGCAREIAAHFGLSRAFVANILKDLCHKGFVISQRGVKGGYFLRQPSAKTTLADLLDALDDPVLLAECTRLPETPCCDRFYACPVRLPLNMVHSRIRGILESVTLAELFSITPTQLVTLDGSRCEPAKARKH